MAVYEYRDLQPTPDALHLYTEWLASLDSSFTRDTTYEARSEIVRDTLRNILPASASTITRAALDPRNITLEPEYYGDMDPARFYPRKPLIWLWLQFDASPLGANQWLGERLRQMLGRHIFARIGERVRIFQHVTFSYGYNLEIGDDCWIHRHVLLDDRGGITLHDGTSISDYANIYSHTHDLVDQRDVSNLRTEIGPRARITYHATVLAGTKVGPDAMLGAMGLATRDVPAHTVALGIPAKPKLAK
ncbi:MAG TPA: acyltransferase [Acidobacteriaceae bacterium]|jgi:acetyltransferase-like isoleucine patch superfamily enzyme